MTQTPPTRRPLLNARLLLKALLMTALSIPWQNALANPVTQADDATPAPRSNNVFLSDQAWINDIGTLLYADPDGDGYFSGISLSIDADTPYSSFEVFAAIDIITLPSQSQDALTERLLTTRNFDIYGYSGSDEYRVDIDLVRNYSPGTYALEVTLFDARTERLIDRVGANDFRNLRNLPLESEDNDTFFTPVSERPIEPANDDIRVSEYAGGTGFGMIMMVLVVALARIYPAYRQRTRELERN